MLVLIDFSNLVWSAFFSSLKFHKYDPENCPDDYTGHVDFFHQKLIKILQDSPCDDYMFVLDHKPFAKFTIYNEYKKNRKRLKFKPKPAIEKLLTYWQSKIIHSEGNEADDAIASYVADNLDQDIVVATTDKDLWQLIENPKTKVYNFHKNVFITKKELEEAYGITEYSQIKLHKTLWGDSGDNVPNLIPRMKKNILPYFMHMDGTLNNFWDVIKANWDHLSDRCKELLEENKDKLKINYELVRLNFDCPYKVEIANFTGIPETHTEDISDEELKKEIQTMF